MILAAGGLLWRRNAGDWQIAIIHRSRYEDWSLPKGKLEEGETWQEAALREVREETGYDARLSGFAGAVAYITERGPKIVRFWHMLAEGEPVAFMETEVREVAWFSRPEALRQLDYPVEQALVETWSGPDQLAS